MCEGRSKKNPLPVLPHGRGDSPPRPQIYWYCGLARVHKMIDAETMWLPVASGWAIHLFAPVQTRGAKVLMNPQQPWLLPDPYTHITPESQNPLLEKPCLKTASSTLLHHYVTICTSAQDSGATVSKAVPMSLQLLLGCDEQPSHQVARTTAEIEMTQPRLARPTWFLGSECVRVCTNISPLTLLLGSQLLLPAKMA